MDMRDFLVEGDKQFRGQLEEFKQVLGGLQEALKAQGEKISQETAQTVQASGRKAVSEAQASLERVAQAAQMVGELAQKASEATEKAAKQSGEMLGRLEQASQRMVTSEQKVETALDELVPKVVGVRESLEKELGAVLRAAATAEAEIKRVVAGIGSTMTKEIEGEFKTKTREAANAVAQRLHGIAEWWSWFSRVGTHVILIVVALSTGISGWWFGQHQMKQEAQDEAVAEVGQRLGLSAIGYRVEPTKDGNLRVQERAIQVPLVLQDDGSYWPMVQKDGKWWWKGRSWNPEQVPTAKAWDKKDNNLLRVDLPK